MNFIRESRKKKQCEGIQEECLGEFHKNDLGQSWKELLDEFQCEFKENSIGAYWH